MNMLNRVVEVVEPVFDYPETPEAVSEPLSVGSLVSLIYRGNPLPVRVEAIEHLGTSFVGRIRGAPGDAPCVRFRLKDVASVD